MLKYSKLIWLGCFLLLFISCGKDRVSTSSVSAGSSGYESNHPTGSPADPASDRFIVTPESAIMSATINTTANSLASASQLLTTSSQQLIENITQVPGCSIKIVDYQHPIPRYSKRIGSNGEKQYSGNLKLEMAIAFDKDKDISQRIVQINNCLQAIPDFKTINSPEDKNATVNLTTSPVIPTINNAGKYRQEILKTKFTALKEVASLTEPAVQFDAQDTKCTSKGNVKIIDRQLSGIELDIDFDCIRLKQFNQ